jgi:hypothetical protein
MFGTTKMEEIKKRFPDVKKIKQNSKGRYFGFRGSKAEIKKNRAAISHLIKPYPKRINDDLPSTLLDGYIK